MEIKIIGSPKEISELFLNIQDSKEQPIKVKTLAESVKSVNQNSHSNSLSEEINRLVKDFTECEGYTPMKISLVAEGEDPHGLYSAVMTKELSGK